MDADLLPSVPQSVDFIARDSECLPLNKGGRSVVSHKLDASFAGRARNVEIDRLNARLDLQEHCGGQRITKRKQ